MKTFQLFTVDAFTTKQPFSGNPAAVCLVNSELSDQEMSSIASEMNLSETAFVVPKDGGGFSQSKNFSLRWFTPTAEVNLCGHATLATAHVLYKECGNNNAVLSFDTKSGQLKTRNQDNKIVLDFPLHDFVQLEESAKFSLEWELAKTISSGNEIGALYFSPEPKKLIVLLNSSDVADLEKLENRAAELLRIHPEGTKVRGIAVTLTLGNGNSEFDIFSRYFAPWVGLNEDPATGSAHCGLGHLWSVILHKNSLKAKQCSKRGAAFYLEIKPNKRIELQGEARTVISGSIKF